MWRWLALIALAFVLVVVAAIVGATQASAAEIEVIEVKHPKMCKTEKIEVPCAFFFAMYLKIRAKPEFCTVQSCHVRI